MLSQDNSEVSVSMPKPSKKTNLILLAVIFMTAVSLCLSSCSADIGLDSDASGLNATYKLSKCSCFLEDGSIGAPSVSADSAILIEAQSGKIIYSKNAAEKRPMASTTKIMTALVALEESDISKTVEISPDAVGIEGSSIYLYPNENLTLEDLVYALMLESANDAAAAIAIEVGGSLDSFADMMNEKANEIGLVNTHFTNPHGLDDQEHYTTAEELAIIAAVAMKNEKFRSVVSTHKKTIPLNGTEGVRLLINHNKMLKNYEDSIGIKTGYTKKSGRCLVSAANRDGVELICVTLNAPDDWRDHKTMLDYGFELYENVVLCEAGEIVINHPVVGGIENYAVISNKDTVSISLPRDRKPIERKIELFPFSYAPINTDEPIGRAVFLCGDEIIGETELYANHSVAKKEYKKSLWEGLSSIFQ